MVAKTEAKAERTVETVQPEAAMVVVMAAVMVAKAEAKAENTETVQQEAAMVAVMVAKTEKAERTVAVAKAVAAAERTVEEVATGPYAYQD